MGIYGYIYGDIQLFKDVPRTTEQMPENSAILAMPVKGGGKLAVRAQN